MRSDYVQSPRSGRGSRLGLGFRRLLLRILNVLRIVGLVTARLVAILFQVLQFGVLLGAGSLAGGLALRLLLLLRCGSTHVRGGGLRHRGRGSEPSDRN